MVVVHLYVLLSVYHRCTVAKWCKIGPRLLLITNKKWRMPRWKSLTLDDLEGCYALLQLNGARLPRLLLITNRKWHTPFQMK